jgi:hypothetical protein
VGLFKHGIHQRGFAMVNVRDNCDVSNVVSGHTKIRHLLGESKKIIAFLRKIGNLGNAIKNPTLSRGF